MVDPLHHSSLLYAVYMTVIVDTLSGLQYQTVVCAFDFGGPAAGDADTARRLNRSHSITARNLYSPVPLPELTGPC